MSVITLPVPVPVAYIAQYMNIYNLAIRLGPFSGSQIKHMKMVDLVGTVGASKYNHLLGDDGGAVAVTGAGLVTGGDEGSPCHGVQIEGEDVTEMQPPTTTLRSISMNE